MLESAGQQAPLQMYQRFRFHDQPRRLPPVAGSRM